MVYFICLFGRRIFKVDVDVLKYPSASDEDIAQQVEIAYDVGGPWIAGITRDLDGT